MKNILLYIFICSIVLFINCGEDIESEITPINTGLYDNQSLLIGNWLVDKIDGESINEFCVLGECLDVDHQFIFSFDSNNSFRTNSTTTYEGETVVISSEGSWSFDESDSMGMTLKLDHIFFDPDFPNEDDITNSKLKVTSISNKRMSAIDIEEKEVIETIYDLKTDSYVESTIINEIRSSMEFFKQ